MAKTYRIERITVEHNEEAAEITFTYRLLVDDDGVQTWETTSQVVADADAGTTDHVAWLNSDLTATVNDNLKKTVNTL